MNSTVIHFERPGVAALHQEAVDEPAADEVLLESAYSAVSAGTERANLLAMPNTVSSRHGFPHRTGYSGAGRVLAVGDAVDGVRPGDRAIIQWAGHRSHCIKKTGDLVLIDDETIDLLDASFAHIASFPLLAIRRMQIQLGEAVAIAGMGLLGAYALQFARLSGAQPVVVIDPSARRRELALELGASAVVDPGDPDAVASIKHACGGRGPQAVVEATGSARALQQALEYIDFRGRIALLGCTRVSDAPIDFYRYVHKRGIALIGVHTSARPELESAPGGWTEADDYRTFLGFTAAGRLHTRPLISEVVAPQDAPAVYDRLAGNDEVPLGFVFDWSLLPPCR